MLWWLFRWVFWYPRYRTQIFLGTSHASADDAMSSALVKAKASGGEIIAIAADAMCCGFNLDDPQGKGGAEWDVYLLVRF